MTVREQMLSVLGTNYSLINLDGEKVIYRNFGDGFDLILQGAQKITVQFWFAGTFMVASAIGVSRAKVPKACRVFEELKHWLMFNGFTNEAQLWKFIRTRNWLRGDGDEVIARLEKLLSVQKHVPE